MEPRTATEIDDLKCQKETELNEAEKNLSTIVVAELEIAKKIIMLQMQRKDLQIAVSKAKQVVKTLATEISILKSKYWKAKDGR